MLNWSDMSWLLGGEWLGWLLWMFLVPWLVCYFLPLVIALVNNHPHKIGVILVNVLTGWTVLGWWAALAWAVMPLTGKRPTSDPPDPVLFD